MIRNDQVGIHEPNPLAHFPPFQIFPNIFPLFLTQPLPVPRIRSPVFSHSLPRSAHSLSADVDDHMTITFEGTGDPLQ